MGKKLDKKDIAILWELYQDSSLPVVKIAKTVGLPKETVKYRLEQLLKRGVLKKCYAIVDSSVLGLRFYETFIKLHGITEEYLQECIKKLKEYKYTGWLLSTSGPFTLCCTFLVRTPAQLYESVYFVRELFQGYLSTLQTNHAVDAHQFNYPFFKEFEKLRLKTARHAEAVELDKINKGLLQIMTENCRTPRKEIAQKLRVTEATVRKRITWLEDKGFIQRYTVLLHPGRAGYFFYILFIHVTLPNKELEEYFKALPEIFYFKMKSVGFYDYKVELYTESESRIHEIEDELYRKFPGVVADIDILHVKKEHAIRYFVDA